MNNTNVLNIAKNVLSQQAITITKIADSLGSDYLDALQLILQSKGYIVIMGVGKSGHIGAKIAATLSSTGTPSIFVHPTEASHGDLGMIRSGDCVILLSKSGTSDELLPLQPILKQKQCSTIMITMNGASPLANQVDISLELPMTQEACPLDLAPTTSTTAMLAIGDAIAINLMQLKDYSSEDFAKVHPAGRLGKRLLTTVDSLAQPLNRVATATAETKLTFGLADMSQYGHGTLLVIENDKCIGIFTDGDLRRLLIAQTPLETIRINEVMIHSYKSISGSALATEALALMQDSQISVLVVVDNEQRCTGIITLHSMLDFGL